MYQLGYKEVNLNLGCPAATVTNRHKGAGLLLDGEHLERMLDEIFLWYDSLAEKELLISLKSRLGFYDDSEAEALMKIYARYPVKELTIHARVREDFYKNLPRKEAFKNAVSIYRENGGLADICYNGSISSGADYENLIHENYQQCFGSVMIGRGLLANPALARKLKGGDDLNTRELREYLDRLYDGYASFIPEERNVIFKLLEHWAFLHIHFRDCEKHLKAIRKSRSKGEYVAAVNNIFASCEFI